MNEYCIVLYLYILYSVSSMQCTPIRSASNARDPWQREESSLERTKIGTWLSQKLGERFPVISVLDRQSRGSGFKSRQGQIFGSRFLLRLHPLANSAMMSTLTAHCQWEDDTAMERTGYPPSYAEAKKLKSIKLHTHGCHMARD